MNRMLKIAGCAMLTSVMFFSCAEEDCPTCPVVDATDATDTMDDTMPAAPTTYEFVDADGASTVSYSGQVVRNLIINDIKTQVTSDPTILTSMYDNDATNQARAIFTSTDPSSVQTTYGDISTKSGSGKIAATASCEVSDCTVYGYGSDPATLMPAWFTACLLYTSPSPRD